MSDFPDFDFSDLSEQLITHLNTPTDKFSVDRFYRLLIDLAEDKTHRNMLEKALVTTKLSNEPSLKTITWQKAATCLDAPEPVLDFVLPGLLAGGVGMINAPGATGKTNFLLKVLISLVLEIPIHDAWKNKKSGKVVFLAAEDPDDVLFLRYKAALQTIPKLTEKQKVMLDKNLHIASLTGRFPKLLTAEHNEVLHDPFWLNFIKEITTDARLLVIDPIIRFHSLDENSSIHMTALVEQLEAIAQKNNCAILFTHHANKSSSLNGTSDIQQAARGSSALTDGIRWQLNLVTMSATEAEKYVGIDDIERKKYVRVVFAKTNYAPPIEDIWFYKGEGGAFKLANLIFDEQAEHRKDIDRFIKNITRSPVSNKNKNKGDNW